MFSTKLMTALVALVATSRAAFTAVDVVNNLEKVTVLSSQTNEIAKDINPTTLFVNSPRMVNNFRQIVNEVVVDITAMQSGPAAPFTTANQSAVCSAFRDFVVVHQQLLNTVIGKHGLLSLTPFTGPVAAVLRTLEGGVDTVAFGIIDLVPTCANGAAKDKAALDRSLDQAIRIYSV